MTFFGAPAVEGDWHPAGVCHPRKPVTGCPSFVSVNPQHRVQLRLSGDRRRFDYVCYLRQFGEYRLTVSFSARDPKRTSAISARRTGSSLAQVRRKAPRHRLRLLGLIAPRRNCHRARNLRRHWSNGSERRSDTECEITRNDATPIYARRVLTPRS